MSNDPFALFADWYAAAWESEPSDAHAMALATVNPTGQPSVRVVLLKAWDERGFVFYTNLDSHKGNDIAANPLVGLDFHWKSRGRQVRVEGRAEAVSTAEADAYFATRARISRLGAWASEQSRTLDDPARLRERLAEQERRFDGLEPPRPPHWSGYRLLPVAIEFWSDGAFRLHDRLLFERGKLEEPWTARRLYP